MSGSEDIIQSKSGHKQTHAHSKSSVPPPPPPHPKLHYRGRGCKNEVIKHQTQLDKTTEGYQTLYLYRVPHVCNRYNDTGLIFKMWQPKTKSSSFFLPPFFFSNFHTKKTAAGRYVLSSTLIPSFSSHSDCHSSLVTSYWVALTKLMGTPTSPALTSLGCSINQANFATLCTVCLFGGETQHL